MATRILVVEDDPNLLETLRYSLAKEGYSVLAAADGEKALEVGRRERPDLIVLDLMLPKLSGLDVCRILRKEMNTPIIILTAKAEEVDKVVGLEVGADDYVTKPFSMRELQARLAALLRRAEMSVPGPSVEKELIKIGDLDIDPDRHRVSRAGVQMDLTAKEYELLLFLAKNRGFVFSREQLLNKVWSYDFVGDTRTVDVHIRWLRRKIETDPGHPEILITVRGTGYKLEG